MAVLTGKRAARTRQSLLAAGFDLLVDRPLDAIPIDDVVSAAGVAKGSFFNHFVDKGGFATAMAAEIRLELEARISKANDDVGDPLARLAGGMQVAVEFALQERKRTIALLRSSSSATSQDHPLNQGVKADIQASISAGLLRKEAAATGVLFWLGLCQVMMANIAERNITRSAAAGKLHEMLVLGLTGLGADEPSAKKIAHHASQILLTSSTT
jgi:AcrR family transcriptional regulator